MHLIRHVINEVSQIRNMPKPKGRHLIVVGLLSVRFNEVNFDRLRNYASKSPQSWAILVSIFCW